MGTKDTDRETTGEHVCGDAACENLLRALKEHAASKGKGTPMLDHDVSLEDLEAALRAGAAGWVRDEAAVDLLIAHGAWLTRNDFRECVGHDAIPPGFPPETAWIDFATAINEEMPAPPNDYKILCLAAELAGDDTGVPIGALLADLDASETSLVLDAVAHALGLVNLAAPNQ
ncbi:MAG: hypothetical protein M0T79_06805 [Actinomycetota bacterium]|nr:hypothetical protein [Actinomycetota bacterium]